MILASLYGILSIGLEITSVCLLGNIHPSLDHIYNFLCLHFIACLTAALTIPSVLPANYRGAHVTSFLFIFSVAFFIPLLGMLGLVFGLIPALWKQQQSEPLTDWLLSPERRLPTQTKNRTRETVSPGQLTGILQHAREGNKRLQALITTLSLETQHALPLLRIALKDTDDNVRLLAFSLLKRKENELSEAIRESMSHLNTDSANERFLHHKALATNIWELAHLETASGPALILCDRARTHAEAGLQLQQSDADLQFLLGRILLKGMNYDGARAAFRRANECGIDSRKVMPFLAEIAFHEQRFSDVGSYLEAMQFADGHLPLNHLAAYWNQGKHEPA